MSIIEKAVNALGKGETKKSADDALPGENALPPGGSTVERAAEELDVESESHSVHAAEEFQEEDSVSESEADTDSLEPLSDDAADMEYADFETESVSEIIARDKYVKLDFDELRHIGVLTPNVPRSTIAEEFRTIKRPLLTNISGDAMTTPLKHGNLIMVTSALEGDGKTFTSLSLAISIAMEQDKTVLFVDADTAKAQAGRVLGIPPDCPGLIDVLEDDNVELSDVLLRTNIEKLRVLPAGDLHTHANELLASEKMRLLMIELSENYSDRVIVFDSPPILLTTEAEVLMNFMGQIVFVVSADMTPHHAVMQAIEHIGEDKMVGMVLNRARQASNPYAYTYGDVYGYGRNRQANTEVL
jgi:protein-tyrosine kinase